MFGIQDERCIQDVQKKVLSELLDLALINGACTQYAHNTVSVAGLQVQAGTHNHCHDRLIQIDLFLGHLLCFELKGFSLSHCRCTITWARLATATSWALSKCPSFSSYLDLGWPSPMARLFVTAGAFLVEITRIRGVHYNYNRDIFNLYPS